MLKLLLVDDDALILNGLHRMIQWEEYDIQVIGCASDGEQAIQILDRQTVNLVITDIQMPFLDGMALSSYIQENYPSIKTVLLSGYQEFDYAREAIRLGIKDYLLKPVDENKLITLMIRLVNEIKQEQEIKKMATNSYRLAKLDYLKSLIKDYSEFDKSSYKKFQIDLKPHYQVCVIKCDDYYNASYHHKYMEASLLKFSVWNICNELIEDSSCFTFEHEKDEIILFLVGMDKKSQIELMDKLISYCDNYLSTHLRIGISTSKHKSCHIHKAYLECIDTFSFIHYQTALTYIFYDDVASIDRQFTSELTAFTNGLQQLMLTPTPLDGLRDLYDYLLRSLSKQVHIRNDHLQLLCTHIAIEGYHLIYNTKRSPESKDNGLLNKHLIQLKSLTVLNAFIDSSYTFLSDLIKEVVANRGTHQDTYIDKATAYIQENYHDETLRLKHVAEYIHVNPSYLSILFKKSLAISFSDYLLETRMKAAIWLLQETKKRIFEISGEIGFSNAQYFSVCFKNYTGLTPKEYRSQSITSSK